MRKLNENEMRMVIGGGKKKKTKKSGKTSETIYRYLSNYGCGIQFGGGRYSMLNMNR